MITPLLSLFCVGLAYGLLGWHLSAYHIVWAMGSWFVAITLTILLLWGEQVTKRMFRLGPRGVVSMLILSGIVTMAVAASTLFGMIVVLLAAQTLARLELQSAGLGRRLTLLLMVVLSISTLSCGWFAGKTYFPSSEYWLTSYLPSALDRAEKCECSGALKKGSNISLPRTALGIFPAAEL